MATNTQRIPLVYLITSLKKERLHLFRFDRICVWVSSCNQGNSPVRYIHLSIQPSHQLVRRRGFDLVECGASSADFGDDLLRWLLPDEGLRVVVPVFGPQLDRFGKLYDRIG